MNLHYKVYSYDKKGSRQKSEFFYVTLNGMQIGPVHFSLKSVLESIEKLKRGEKI